MRLALFLALLAAAGVSEAQSSAGVEAGACYGFSFGTWSPPLDWRKAGHDSVTAGQRIPQAPGGRDWASDGTGSSVEELFLYPSWWPAGVAIRFEAGAPVESDTVRARATALVADGKVTPPVAQVRVWRTPCAKAPSVPSSPRDSVPDGALDRGASVTRRSRR